MVAGVVLTIALIARRQRKIVFGSLFFLFNVVLVLQLVPVGGAVAADRYTYVASIGLAYLAGEGYAWLCRRPRLRVGATAAVLVLAVLLGMATWQRCGVWKNRLTLFGDVIAKYPRYHAAYDIRGVERSARGDKRGAIADFDETLRLRPDYARTYNNRGNARADLGDLQGALADFDRAIELQPAYGHAHYNRGYVLGEMGDLQGAIDAMSAAIRHAPRLAPAYINRGDAYRWLGRIDEAIRDYDAALVLDPDNPVVYRVRGEAHLSNDDPGRALTDLRRAERLGQLIDPELLRALEERTAE